MDMKEQLKKEMISWIRRLPATGWLFSTSGNMSARCADGTILITPSAVEYETMHETDIFEFSADGVLQKKGKNRPTSSLRFHLALMNARPDCNCVLHTHAPYCLAASTVTDCVPPVTLNSKILLGKDGIRTAKYAENGSEEEARNIVETIGSDNHACLMQNHGVVTIGSSIEAAWLNMGYAEDCCRAWLLAKSTGLEISYIH